MNIKGLLAGRLLPAILSSLLVPALLVPGVSAAEKETDIDSEQLENVLRQLDDALANRSKMRRARTALIDSLKHNAVSHPTAEGYGALAQAFVQVNNDSALHYYNYAIDLAQGPERELLTAKRASLLPVAGFVEPAAELFESVDTAGFTLRQLADYYDAGRSMYINMTAFHANYPEVAIKWSAKATECQEEMMRALADDADANRFRTVYGEYLLRTGRRDLAEIALRDVIESEPETSALRSRAAHVLSHIVGARGEKNSQLRYLAMSTLGDLKAGAVEMSSLQDLGMMLGQRGDDERAFRYLNVSMADAYEAASRIRMVQTSSAVPVVQGAYVSSLQTSRHTLRWVVGTLVVVLLLLIISIFFLYRNMRRISVGQRRLESANRTKELYMSQFLSLCSVYMERLTNFSNMVMRKIAAGKIDDVARMVKTGRFINEQTGEFFAVFDDAFLHIYPTFVEDVNRLLRPECRIVLKEGERLNADLRILAFTRMGIDDASKIAQILNYSVNTIYAYRNKMKLRAIDRSTFEADIMRIDSV